MLPLTSVGREGKIAKVVIPGETGTIDTIGNDWNLLRFFETSGFEPGRMLNLELKL